MPEGYTREEINAVLADVMENTPSDRVAEIVVTYLDGLFYIESAVTLVKDEA